MNEMFRCGDGTALVAYLYDEVSPGERRVIAAHVAECRSCSDVLAGLGATRQQLATWAPPEAALDFRIIREPVKPPVQPLRWWRQPTPAWMQAAAALLVFAAGLSVGALRGSDRTAPAPTSAVADPAAASVSPSDLSGLETRLRAEMAELRAASARPVPVASDRRTDEAVLRRVQSLIQESEERQRRELALRTTQVVRDLDAQRRTDLTRVQQTMGQIEGTTGAELRQQREMWNFLMNNVSQRGAVR